MKLSKALLVDMLGAIMGLSMSTSLEFWGSNCLCWKVWCAASLWILTASYLGKCFRSEQSKFVSLLHFLLLLRGKCENPWAEEMKFGRVPCAESVQMQTVPLSHCLVCTLQQLCHICWKMSINLHSGASIQLFKSLILLVTSQRAPAKFTQCPTR